MGDGDRLVPIQGACFLFWQVRERERECEQEGWLLGRVFVRSRRVNSDLEKIAHSRWRGKHTSGVVNINNNSDKAVRVLSNVDAEI